MPLHRPRLVLATTAFATVMFGVLAFALAADSDPAALDRRIQEVEKELKAERAKALKTQREADQLRQQMGKTRDERISAAREIQTLEKRATDIEREIQELDSTQTDIETQLRQRRGEFARLLAALQRLSQIPPEAVLTRPGSPSELIRSAILLRTAVNKIEAQSARLRKDLIALAETRKLLSERRKELEPTMVILAREQTRLDGLISRTAALRAKVLDARRAEVTRVETLAKKASSLRQLFQDLLEPRNLGSLKNGEIPMVKAPPPPQVASRAPIPPSPPLSIARPISQARGELVFPVSGRIIEHYGQTTREGLTHKGISLESRSGARVIAPYDGTIVFAGIFRGYGQLLIISHGEGYHSLLAGMSRIDGILGQSLRAGEPIGVMTGSPNTRPKLYIELRRGGQPINPVPWLKSSKGKASG
ncbi:MAG: peptidoglycan DD-metalloendopeptidase family protein [Proteobacteria bacterium]|nr:peptidoglycan DD-metalloendopeptidase family protein [Pseudomonadota bacterium]